MTAGLFVGFPGSRLDGAVQGAHKRNLDAACGVQEETVAAKLALRTPSLSVARRSSSCRFAARSQGNGATAWQMHCRTRHDSV